MGTTLVAGDTWVEERFAEIVRGEQGPSGVITAKVHPYEDPSANPEPEREGEGPEGDEDVPDDGDVEFP